MDIPAILSLDERSKWVLKPGNDCHFSTTWLMGPSQTNSFLYHEVMCQTRYGMRIRCQWRQQGNQNMQLLVSKLVIPNESTSLWLWEARHGMSDFSSMNGMDMNLVRRDCNRCLNSWTRRKRDVKHDETNSSLYAIVLSRNVACRTWSIQSSLGYVLTYLYTV